jgi:hypothetical protein
MCDACRQSAYMTRRNDEQAGARKVICSCNRRVAGSVTRRFYRLGTSGFRSGAPIPSSSYLCTAQSACAFVPKPCPIRAHRAFLKTRSLLFLTFGHRAHACQKKFSQIVLAVVLTLGAMAKFRHSVFRTTGLLSFAAFRHRLRACLLWRAEQGTQRLIHCFRSRKGSCDVWA